MPSTLAAKDRQLAPQHQDLGVHAVARQGFYDATKETVEEAERHASHDRCSHPPRPSQGSRCWTLQGLELSCVTRRASSDAA